MDIKLLTLHVSGCVELVRRILNCGADVHAEDQIGNTALHVAVLHGHTQVISALHAAG